ncbi:Bardet-Biedl syndrome 4 protein homolog isoform X2 [Drosophila sulfurigaster albostrigata]|uniref:Bardet-Biedl syndrome 4 protein homolog isoform X2 n=1 Tax=Drosophila sulfurigaster albostrigata TaxID=89887 RepID=UPI002D21D273|nr:Bardet-Biedl syndrome 4 protein homolog isoform X2 [Drosophila sulfurigaster albostrigata]
MSSFFYPAAAPKYLHIQLNFMYEAGSEQINCNGAVIALPSLEVVKADANIDWLLHIYFTRREFERCRRLIERELNRHLNAEYLYFVKGLIDREDGNNIEALRNLQKAVELNSKNIETYKEIGRTLYNMGRFGQALSVFREAEQHSPRRDHEIYHYLGELLYRAAATQPQLEMARQQQAEARGYFELAVQTGKKLESYVRLAELYRKDKEYQQAIDVLEACLHLTPENAEVLTEISVLYLKINETQRAYDRLTEVVNIERKCTPKGLLALGAILQSRNDVDGALGKYSQIADAEPEIAELWNNIGLCFFKKQKFIVAVSSLRKSIWISPLNYNALYNLSLIYIASEQYASAFHTLAASINLRKDNAECYMLLGLCLRKLDDTENAFVAFERACNLAQGQQGGMRHPLVFLNFALFCYETGRLALATEQYNRFMAHAQDLLLPTEFKFQATKLKSLLRISSHNHGILGDGEDTAQLEAEASEVPEEMPLEVNAVVSQN